MTRAYTVDGHEMVTEDCMTTTKRKPFTKRERHYFTQNGLGYRPVNDWGDGDLPAPYAEGDVLRVREGAQLSDRFRGMTGPYFVVTYATSIDEGDAWYFRVSDGDGGSDRLHVAWVNRSEFDEDCDWMAPLELVETADDEGLAERQRLLDAGWSYTGHHYCPTCGQRVS